MRLSSLLFGFLTSMILLLLVSCSENETAAGSGMDSADPPQELPTATPAIETTQVETGDFLYNFWEALGNHPLDVQLRQCADENPGDAGGRECLVNFLEKWDEELNTQYQNVRGMLTGEQGEALKLSQRSWMSYRDAEFEFIESQYQGLTGTMFERIVNQEKLMVVRHRALELLAYDTALGVDR